MRDYAKYTLYFLQYVEKFATLFYNPHLTTRYIVAKKKI